mgnify:FL=1
MNKLESMKQLETQLMASMTFLIWQMDNIGAYGDVEMVTHTDTTHDILEKFSQQLEIARKIIEDIEKKPAL